MALSVKRWHQNVNYLKRRVLSPFTENNTCHLRLTITLTHRMFPGVIDSRRRTEDP